MAGRPGVIRRDQLIKIFESYREKIVRDNKVIVPSDKIWQDLSINIVKNASAKSIYTAALRWWKEMTVKQTIDDSVVDGQSDCEDTSLSSVTNNKINFNVYLSGEVWQQISPVPQKYYRKKDRDHKGKSRTYLVLKPGIWTNVLIERIAEHRKNIICNWSFKRNKVSVSGNYFVVVTATCVTCSATLNGFIKDEPKHPRDRVKFCFVVRNFDKSRHQDTNKTVRNTGTRANDVFSSTKPALYLHQKMSSKNTNMFEHPKGRQFTLNAIRCGKHRKKTAKKLSSCPYTAIMYIQAMNCYANTIHAVGISPFNVIYTSSDQIKLFKAYKLKNRYTRIQCDASGNLAHKLGKLSFNMKLEIRTRIVWGRVFAN